MNRTDPASDEALVVRIANGDRLAMQALYARCHVRVYRFILRFVRNEATAEDVMSEVFLDVWRQAGRFEARSSATTWILSIARFKALSAVRRRGEQALDEEAAAQIPDTADSPEAALEGADRAAVLRRCMARLSQEHREVIDLVYYHERSVQDAARIIGVPEGTVKTRMFHARRNLGQMLAAQGVQ